MPSLAESTSAFTPSIAEPLDWRIGSASFDPPVPQINRRRHLRIVVGDLAAPLDPSEQRYVNAIEQALQHSRAMREVQERVLALGAQAAESDEPFSWYSARDLVEFLRALSITQRPTIFLLENGNLQSVWRNTDREQVSLQFFGKNVVQFALFALRQHQPMARVAGRDGPDQVRAKITEHGCRHLIV
jgi:hypothetical protein